MKRIICAMLVILGQLAGQPSGAKAISVAPGKQTDITVEVRSPVLGDMIDVLVSESNAGAVVDLFLPDGRELTDDIAEQNGFQQTGVLGADLGRIDPTLRKALISGHGDHIVWIFIDKPLGGLYRLRADNRTGTTPVRLKVAFVSLGSISPSTEIRARMDSLRSTPGVKITNAVKVPPGSTGTKLSLPLPQSTEAAQIDVASTGEHIAISLRLPDGTVVTQDNAMANGLEWQQLQYPPDMTDVDPLSLPFVIAFVRDKMLPVKGVHYEIRFPGGVRQAGTYTVNADGRQSTTAAEVRAMFVPLEPLNPLPER